LTKEAKIAIERLAKAQGLIQNQAKSFNLSRFLYSQRISEF